MINHIYFALSIKYLSVSVLSRLCVSFFLALSLSCFSFCLCLVVLSVSVVLHVSVFVSVFLCFSVKEVHYHIGNDSKYLYISCICLCESICSWSDSYRVTCCWLQAAWTFSHQTLLTARQGNVFISYTKCTTYILDTPIIGLCIYLLEKSSNNLIMNAQLRSKLSTIFSLCMVLPCCLLSLVCIAVCV